jgi:CheY-like chemotaxis protein
VDDVRDTRELYQYFLGFQGVRALTAADGEEALRMIADTPPDVIVLDLAMPRVTGWDVLRALKADPRSRPIPVLVLSGNDARQSALQAGADAYLQKPCLPDELYREILKVLRQPSQSPGH